MESCDECREQEEAYRLLAEAWRTKDRALRAHPPAERLVALAMNAPEIGADERTSLASHLASCIDCDDAVATIRSAEADLHETADDGERTRFGRTALAFSFAAGLVALVLGYPAYLGLSRVPRLERELAAVRAEMDRPVPKTEVDVGRSQRAADPAAALPSVPSEWRGPAAVHYLRPTHRGAGRRGAGDRGAGEREAGGDDDGAVEVAIAPGEPFVLLALGEELLSDHVRPGREYTFEIAGRSTTLGAQRILAELSSPSAAVILPVPAEALTEGSHDVTVREQGAQGRPILVAPFRVRRHLQSPAATNAPQ